MTTSRYSSRKFLFAVFTVAIASFLVYYGSIDGDTWKSVVSIVVTGYLAANVAQKYTENKVASATTTTSSTVVSPQQPD